MLAGTRKSDDHTSFPNNSDDDYNSEEDDQPLNLRIPPKAYKFSGSPNTNNNTQHDDDKNLAAVKEDDSDTDDKKLLSSTLMKNSKNNDTNNERNNPLTKYAKMDVDVQEEDDSDDEKPLSLRQHHQQQQEGVMQSGKLSQASKKRPADEPRYSQSSAKKKVKRLGSDGNNPFARLRRQLGQKKNKEVVEEECKNVEKSSNYAMSVKECSDNGSKWTSFVHNGVCFPPSYVAHGVKMLYGGKPVDLSPEQEEVATMYATKLETDYVKIPKFNMNFFNDWRKILGKNHVIQEFEKCDFTPIYQWILKEKEKKSLMTSEEKNGLKKCREEEEDKYKWAIVDGVKEKVGAFKVEPPSLFLGRGVHPKSGKIKKRILPSDITINIGKEAPIPECPIPGQRWKEVLHDNTVTWLACWEDAISGKKKKYVFLAASSNLKGKKDAEKYEKARELKNHIDTIRTSYRKDFVSKDMMKQQIAVATYLIDELALRAGNDKDDDEADTVGCCSLKVENVKPIPPNILEFDFLGKDSVKFYQKFKADPLVYKATELFRKGKRGEDELFDKLDTAKLNAHLKTYMPGLTAKVFRTYNASQTLDNLLCKEPGDVDLDVRQKVENHRLANKQVAILCNHQKSVSKSYDSQREKRSEKLNEIKTSLSELLKDLDRTKKGKLPLENADGTKKRKTTPEALEKKILKTKQRIQQMERDMQSKEDMKNIALTTSKTNYLDPRITVAWCKRNEVPIERIFSKADQAKFVWAMDIDPSFRF